MIIVITGEMESGKSAMLEGLVAQHAPYDGLTNFWITSRPSDVSTDAFTGLLQGIVEHDGKNRCLALDENYYWFDSRSSLSNRNKLFCAAVARVKADGGHVFITSQEFHFVDKRIRMRTDFILRCERVENKEKMELGEA